SRGSDVVCPGVPRPVRRGEPRVHTRAAGAAAGGGGDAGMSTIGTHVRNSRIARLLRSTPARQGGEGAEPSAAPTPYWLLWSTGAVAVVLGVIALALWGLNGPATLLDMIVALCT